MNLKRLSALGPSGIFVVSAMFASIPGHAATILFDDFEDGSFNDDSPVTWQGDLGGMLAIEDGSLIVSGFSVPLAVPEIGPSENVSIQVQMRVLEGDYAGIAGRRTTGVRRGYFAAVGEYLNNGVPTNDVFLAYAGSLEVLHAQDVDFDPKLEDVILQMDIFGNEITYWAWPADEGRPAEPIGKIVDDVLASVSGGIYLWASSPGLSGSLTGRAAFRYVRVADIAIPEPSSLALVGSVIAALLFQARRHAGRRAKVTAISALALAVTSAWRRMPCRDDLLRRLPGRLH
jgi:hypothetical protein